MLAGHCVKHIDACLKLLVQVLGFRVRDLGFGLKPQQRWSAGGVGIVGLASMVLVW